MTPHGAAVVTGAAAGLGRAFALALAGAGHDIAVLDVADGTSTVEEARALGVDAVGWVGDASRPADVAAFASGVRGTLAPVRVLVNNAGISPYLPFDQTGLEEWHRVLRVNLDSAYLITQAFLPDLRASGAGRVVNVTSSVVWDALARDMVAYATSKAALVGLTRALATELGVDGITVNAIAPGIVLTPDIASRVPQERLDTYRDRQAIKRIAEPDDLASTLLYLVDQRTRHVTGAVVPVNGGRVFL